MPSPIGHVLAGLAVAYATDRRGAATPRFVLACALLAAAPDLDLLVPGTHRRFSHSLFATGLVMLVTWAITRVRAGRADWRVVIACTLATASHLVTDYFSADPATPSGIQLFWPWQRWLKSNWALFLRDRAVRPVLGVRNGHQRAGAGAGTAGARAVVPAGVAASTPAAARPATRP